MEPSIFLKSLSTIPAMLWGLAKPKVERSHLIIATLKGSGFELLKPDFESVYAHALVEYAADVELGQDQTKRLWVEFFSLKEVSECIKVHLFKKPDESLQTAFDGILHTQQGELFLKLKNINAQTSTVWTEYYLLHKYLVEFTQKSQNPAQAQNTQFSQSILEEVKNNNVSNETINLLVKREFELVERLRQSETEKVQLFVENITNKELIKQAENDRKELIDFYKLYPTIYKSKLESLEATKNLEQLVKEDDEKIELRKKLEEEELKGSAVRRIQLADQLKSHYDFTGAFENYDKATQLSPKLIQAKISKGDLLDEIGEHHKARNIFLEVRDDNQFNSLDTLTKVDIFDKLGCACIALFRFDEALKSFQDGSFFIQKAHKELMQAQSEQSSEFTFDWVNRFNSALTRGQNNIGIAYLKLGDLENAYTHLNSCLELSLKLFGENDYMVSLLYNNLGDILRTKNKIKEAKQYFEKSLQWFVANKHTLHPALPTLYGNLSNINLQLGNKEEALQFAKESLNIAISMYGSNSPHVANSYMRLGHSNRINGNLNEALLNYQNAEAIYLKGDEVDGRVQLTEEKANGVIDSHLTIAYLLMDEKQWSKAIEWFDFPLFLISDKDGEDSIQVGNIIADKGLCVFNSRESNKDNKSISEAKKFWQKAISIFQKDERCKNKIDVLEDNILYADELLNE
jgi:Tetratricopeptide repeat